MSRTLIKNGIVITQNSLREISFKNILIDQDRIIALDNQIYEAHEVIDAERKYICPGLIQSHVHLSLPDNENLDNINSSEELLKLYSIQSPDSIQPIVYENLQLLIRGGTTTILAMEHPLFTDTIFQILQNSGIRAVVGNAMIDYGEKYTDLQETTEQCIARSNELFEKWHNSENGRIQYAICPWSIPVCSGQMWAEIAVFANAHNLKIHTHAAETKSEVRAVKHGRSSDIVNYLDQFDLVDQNLILANSVWLNSDELEFIRKRKVNLAVCPSSNQLFDTGLPPVREWENLGINLSLGSDGRFCNPGLDIFLEMQKIRDIHSLSPQNIFDMATINGAKTLGLEKDIGSIEIGKKADLLILDMPIQSNDVVRNLVEHGKTDYVKTVMIDGKIVYRIN